MIEIRRNHLRLAMQILLISGGILGMVYGTHLEKTSPAGSARFSLGSLYGIWGFGGFVLGVLPFVARGCEAAFDWLKERFRVVE